MIIFLHKHNHVKNLYSRAYFSQILMGLWDRFGQDSLFRNSIYLMLSTLSMALFGFVFWIITTHFFSSTQIGLGAALISATILLSNLSLLGFNTSLIKYLPHSKNPSSIINTALVTVALTTVVISVIYLIVIDIFSPNLYLLLSNPGYKIFFILFMILVSLNTLTDSVFIAYRFSKYNLIVYTLFGVTKIILPFFLIGYGSYGVFFAYTGAVIVAFGFSIYFMVKRFDYKPSLSIDIQTVKNMSSFSIINFIAGFLSGLPTLLTPLIIANKLGGSASAYFYMANTIVALLYIIPQAITQSLFAEGSHDKDKVYSSVIDALKLITTLLIPGIIALFVFGKIALLIFGSEYSVNSAPLLRIMSLTSIFLCINLIGATLLKIHAKLKELLIVNMLYFIVNILFIFLWLKYGVKGVAWSLFAGHVFLSFEYIVIFSRNKKLLLNAS